MLGAVLQAWQDICSPFALCPGCWLLTFADCWPLGEGEGMGFFNATAALAGVGGAALGG
jgi:hypothetical protein